MAKDKSQKKQVIEKLERDGHVTRNWCLRRYISRLSAIIYDLREEGWRFDGEFIQNEKNRGKDYRYKLIHNPNNE